MAYWDKKDKMKEKRNRQERQESRRAKESWVEHNDSTVGERNLPSSSRKGQER